MPSSRPVIRVSVTALLLVLLVICLWSCPLPLTAQVCCPIYLGNSAPHTCSLTGTEGQDGCYPIGCHDGTLAFCDENGGGNITDSFTDSSTCTGGGTLQYTVPPAVRFNGTGTQLPCGQLDYNGNYFQDAVMSQADPNNMEPGQGVPLEGGNAAYVPNNPASSDTVLSQLRWYRSSDCTGPMHNLSDSYPNDLQCRTEGSSQFFGNSYAYSCRSDGRSTFQVVQAYLSSDCSGGYDGYPDFLGARMATAANPNGCISLWYGSGRAIGSMQFYCGPVTSSNVVASSSSSSSSSGGGGGSSSSSSGEQTASSSNSDDGSSSTSSNSYTVMSSSTGLSFSASSLQAASHPIVVLLLIAIALML